MELKTGDIVRVTSIRGPYMLVDHVTEGEDKKVVCRWYSEKDDMFRSETFRAELLEKVR